MIFRVTLLLFFTILLSQKAYAYPSFIGYGYSSCLACHYNPMGKGPITDYGRAISATTISAKPFFQPNATDEELGETSGFIGNHENLPSWLRPTILYRGMYLVTGLESDNPKKRWINMQADASLTLKFFDDRLILTGMAGFNPPSSTPSATKESSLVTREHYAGLRFTEEMGLYVGLMDPAYGIRIPDHTAYSRTRALIDKNDQVHGAMFHSGGKKWEFAAHAFAGNMIQKSTLRQKGGSFILEHEPKEKIRIGVSGWSTSGTFRTRQMAAVHSRLGFQKGSSLLFETGFIREKPLADSLKIGNYVFIQTMNGLARGMHVLFTFESFADAYNLNSTRFYRAGPSLQFFPFHRFEWRTDFLATRATGQSAVNPDSLTFLTQFHFYL